MAPLPLQTAAFIRAGLTSETILALQEVSLQDSSENLLGQFSAQPELGPDAAADTPHPSHHPNNEPLPLVWQDLFGCATRAASNGYLARLAGMPSLLSPAAPAAEGGRSTSGAAIGSCSVPDQTTMAHDTVFRDFLSPEALVQRHRLGAPEVRRLYQTMQVRHQVHAA